jgi:hypothetical protein
MFWYLFGSAKLENACIESENENLIILYNALHSKEASEIFNFTSWFDIKINYATTNIAKLIAYTYDVHVCFFYNIIKIN